MEVRMCDVAHEKEIGSYLHDATLPLKQYLVLAAASFESVQEEIPAADVFLIAEKLINELEYCIAKVAILLRQEFGNIEVLVGPPDFGKLEAPVGVRIKSN